MVCWENDMNYQEAEDYIYSLPKFTTKNSLEHTRQFLKLPECRRKRAEDTSHCRHKWKRFRLCLSAGASIVRRKDSWNVYFASSCKDE